MEHRPDAVALQHGSVRLTYRELWKLSGVLAERLRRRGVRPDEPVAVPGERSLRVGVALLAIFRTGGAYLALGLLIPTTGCAARSSWPARGLR